MRIGIDLTWLKPKKSGGVEFYIKNLIDGMLLLEDDNKYVLFLAKDNSEYLREYFNDDRITTVDCNTYAFNVKQHLIWQNLFQYRILKKNNIDFCFFPVYEMPLYRCKKIKTVTTIHDIQAFHYPEYFSKLENIWFKMAWQRDLKIANSIVAITEYTRQDLMKNFKHRNNVVKIYITIDSKDNEIADFSEIKNKYKIDKNGYYYTVSSMHKHKNLITIVKTIKEIKDRNLNIPKTLVISGVGGPNKDNLINQIKEMGVEDNIIITDFISNSEKYCLMKNSNCFLFPSIFEGFGMPPVEAMSIGAKVITTKETSIPEVTKERCSYVRDALNENDWIEEIEKIQNVEAEKITFEEYDNKIVARQYLDLFYKINK